MFDVCHSQPRNQTALKTNAASKSYGIIVRFFGLKFGGLKSLLQLLLTIIVASTNKSVLERVAITRLFLHLFMPNAVRSVYTSIHMHSILYDTRTRKMRRVSRPFPCNLIAALYRRDFRSSAGRRRFSCQAQNNKCPAVCGPRSFSQCVDTQIEIHAAVHNKLPVCVQGGLLFCIVVGQCARAFPMHLIFSWVAV